MTGVEPPSSEIDHITLWVASDPHVHDEMAPGYELGESYLLKWMPLANAASKDAVVLVGDQAHTEAYIEEAAGHLETLASYHAVLGNHDMLDAPGNNYHQAKIDAVDAYGMPGEYYAFDMSFARVIVLNTNYDGSDNDAPVQEGHLPAAQQAWLQNEVDTTTKDAVLIFMHHPPIETVNGGLQFDTTDIGELTTIVNSRENVWIISAHSHPANNYRFYLMDVLVWCLAPMIRGHYSICRLSKLADGSITLALAEQKL